ncbi:universal stress protein [Nocardia aurantiaca]|uniref:Universal stress protein n=1 Tax=Nocardia aurantiaca TaxID=2675850 RepID=A0A6I3L374_9NOCA|nr:universal stress protein [Nocardia aurantiaca]MTE14329.1 universal stress protein [Nocardia aurantiaca]
MEENTAPARSFAHTDHDDLGIVVGVDGSEISYQAVAWAAVEADTRGCALHIVTSYANPIVPGATELDPEDMRDLRLQGQQVLADAASLAAHAVPGKSLHIRTELIFDMITGALIERSRRAQLLVVGNRGLGAIRRAVLGSVSTALTRHAHCPVAVVHGMSETDPAASSKPVVVGVDGSLNSVPAIDLAFDEASRRKVDLIAVHAWTDTSGFDLPVMGWESIRESQDVLLKGALADYAKRYPDVTVHRVVALDTPVRALLEQADKAQLVVVGSHGRGGFAGMMLGSVSTALLHLAQCPVLVVRQPSQTRAEEPAGQ